MSTHANRVKMTVTSVASAGTGDITLNAASTGFRSFATAYGANATVDILITEGTAWEIARNCTYTHSGTTVSRGTLENSSTGSAVAFTSAAVVSVIATAGFGNAVDNTLGAWGALNGENSITGTATAVIGRLNVCSGTSANYTVALPPVSGNAGKYIGFRMAAGLTKLVTLDGDGTETIDGSTTRVMWAGETALLYCDGSTWTKMAGKSVPMSCSMSRTTTKTISASTESLVEMNAIANEAPAGLGNATSGRITVARPGNYSVATAGAMLLSANSGNNQVYPRQNGAKVEFLGLMPGLNGQYVGPTSTHSIYAAASDYFEMGAYSDVSATFSANTPLLVVLEIPQW